MSKKVKIAITSIICFILFIAVAFMITSLTMASVNDRSLVDEWKSWGTAIEEADNGSELVSNGESGTVDVQNLANNYSNIVIVA